MNKFIWDTDFHVAHQVVHLNAAEYVSGYRDEQQVLVYCQGCETYNRCWACPPFEFDTTEYLSGYQVVHLIVTTVTLSPNLIASIRGEVSANEAAIGVMRAVRAEMDERLLELEAIVPNSKICFAGTCLFCEKGCARENNKPCVYSHKIRPSLEALGFDIVKSAKELLHTEVKWSKDGILPEYLVLVSAWFAQEPLSGLINLD